MPICRASPSSYIGGSEQSNIDDNRASEVSASAPLRVLALSNALCPMAMKAVPAAAYFGLMPANAAMLGDKASYCSIMKDHGDFNSDGSVKVTCGGKTAAQCYNGCEFSKWDTKCKVFQGSKSLSFVNPDAGSPAKIWMEKQVACNKLSESACATADCAYKDSKCDISTAALKTICCNTAGSVNMFKLYMKCSAITNTSLCTGQCAWKDRQGKCDMNALVGYKMFFGAVAGAKLSAMGDKTSMCSDIGTDVTRCRANSKCKVGLLGCELGVDPALKTAMDACKVHSQSNCSAASDCSWNSNANACGVHPTKTGAVCGWQTAASGSSQPSMVAFFLFVTVSVASIAASLMQA